MKKALWDMPVRENRYVRFERLPLQRDLRMDNPKLQCVLLPLPRDLTESCSHQGMGDTQVVRTHLHQPCRIAPHLRAPPSL